LVEDFCSKTEERTSTQKWFPKVNNQTKNIGLKSHLHLCNEKKIFKVKNIQTFYILE
jgi:hypothetical protein